MCQVFPSLSFTLPPPSLPPSPAPAPGTPLVTFLWLIASDDFMRSPELPVLCSNRLPGLPLTLPPLPLPLPPARAYVCLPPTPVPGMSYKRPKLIPGGRIFVLPFVQKVQRSVSPPHTHFICPFSPHASPFSAKFVGESYHPAL